MPAGSTPARGVLAWIPLVAGLVAVGALLLTVGALLSQGLLSLRSDRHSPVTDRG